ncbi:hypothetical protein LEM8419_00122 [Neolewinella maritima]|uniref:PEGA domain-containing protein n=1 Tax=Neolewinella maritima TaxID=1383882 RepID=A0ABM9AX55_9BACT|nr:hypothetical protein [Neolewinella maritima]CAH0998784.1 hypothetical protein LEM8419_00122 [Neolewinella maritima]
MFKQITFLVLAAIVLASSSCATIVSKSSYPIMINSTPASARITITDKRGNQVFQGATPALVDLSASSGFFSKAFYQVSFELPGYDRRLVPINYKLDGWYFGNIVFGGLLGMLIIDPATGAMFKLDTEFVNETLTQSVTTAADQTLRVYSLDEIPAAWTTHLVEIAE